MEVLFGFERFSNRKYCNCPSYINFLYRESKCCWRDIRLRHERIQSERKYGH